MGSEDYGVTEQSLHRDYQSFLLKEGPPRCQWNSLPAMTDGSGDQSGSGRVQ